MLRSSIICHPRLPSDKVCAHSRSKELKEIAQKIMDAKKEDKAFYRLAFTIKELSSTGAEQMLQFKHEIGWPVKCTGFVCDGKCLRCGIDVIRISLDRRIDKSSFISH